MNIMAKTLYAELDGNVYNSINTSQLSVSLLLSISHLVPVYFWIL